jgi:hypothetical protein
MWKDVILNTVYSQTALLSSLLSPTNSKARITNAITQPIPSPSTKRKYKSTVTQKRCQNCDECFTPSKSTQKFCSNKCRQRSHRLNKVNTIKSNGKYCVRCNTRLVNRQQKYCSNTCKQLTYRAKKRATVHQYQQLGIRLATVLDSIELVGMSKSVMALEQLGYTYSYGQKQWIG